MGAEYVITQLFYDNQKYFSFVKQCREAGINVPIVPGLKPLTKKRQLTILPKIFGCDIPNDFVKAVEACHSDDDVKQVGIEWLTMQCKELMAQGVPDLHFYALNATDSVLAVAKEIY